MPGCEVDAPTVVGTTGATDGLFRQRLPVHFVRRERKRPLPLQRAKLSPLSVLQQTIRKPPPAFPLAERLFPRQPARSRRKQPALYSLVYTGGLRACTRGDCRKGRRAEDSSFDFSACLFAATRASGIGLGSTARAALRLRCNGTSRCPRQAPALRRVLGFASSQRHKKHRQKRC